MKNFIFDFETLGMDATSCPVLDCSYVAFEPSRFESDNPYTFDELLKLVQTDKLEVQHQIKEYGYKISKDTLNWWAKQSAPARNRIRPLDTDMTVEKFIDLLLTYLYKEAPFKYWWSRANTFDPIILYRLFKSSGDREHELNNILKWWNIRDTRTFIDAKLNFPKINAFIPTTNIDEWNNKFYAHNSAHDIIADILRLQMIVRAENELEY